MPKDLTRVCVQVIYCVVFLQGKTEFGEIKVKKEKKGGGYKKKAQICPQTELVWVRLLKSLQFIWFKKTKQKSISDCPCKV